MLRESALEALEEAPLAPDGDPDGLIAQAAENALREAGFDPAQTRDATGKWSKSKGDQQRKTKCPRRNAVSNAQLVNRKGAEWDAWRKLTTEQKQERAEKVYAETWAKVASLFGAEGQPPPKVEWLNENLPGTAVSEEPSAVVTASQDSPPLKIVRIGSDMISRLSYPKKAGHKELVNQMEGLIHEFAHVYQDDAIFFNENSRLVEEGAELFADYWGHKLFGSPLSTHGPPPYQNRAAMEAELSSVFGPGYWQQAQFGRNWGKDPTTIRYRNNPILEEGEFSDVAMVALYPDAATAAAVALDGGDDPDKIHLTLGFLGKIAGKSREDALRAVRAWAAACPPLKGEISGVGKFVSGPDPVTYLSVDLPELPHRREELVNLLDGEQVPPARDHGFTPHMTLDYASRRPKVEKPIPLTFTHATLSWGDERIDVPFTGTEKLAEGLVDHAKVELEKAGLNSPESDYGGMLGNEILRIVQTFSEGGHSGGSAAVTLAALEKLLRYEPLTPLTSDPGEWMHIADERTNGKSVWQNRRNPAAFSEDGGKTWKLLEAAQLLEGKWDSSLHPRWPKGTPKAGEFITVGQTFISDDGKEWQVAHIVRGKVIAHRVGKTFKEAETGVFHPKKEKGSDSHVIPDAKKEGAPRAISSSQAKGLESGVTTVDPYVDHASHNASIPVPDGSKISGQEWQRFGEIDQEHYSELMDRFGGYTPSKAKALIDESYQDYEAEIQSIVKNAYSSQYGSSSGFTLSLGAIFHHFGGSNKVELKKLDEQRKRALELQGRHKDVIAWDLYNRTRSPDIAVFHKNTEGPAYWKNMMSGQKPIMSGLSQSFNFGANFGFGNNTLATPLAIRHVLMSSYSAQPIPGSTHFQGELEISVAEQMKIDERSLYFSLHDITANQKKWLMGVTKAPTSGAAIERFKEALQSGEMLPTPPAPPDIQMAGVGQKLWIDPPPEAAEFTKSFAGMLPPIASASYNPAELNKDAPWAFKDSAGNPLPTVAKDSELKPGDYMMGLKGTLYLIVEDPGDSTGFGLRYVKIEGGKFSGESYNFDGGGTKNYYKLDKHFELPDPHQEKTASDLFDPNGWVNSEKEAFVGKLQPGEKFKVNGNPYEVKAQLSGAQTQITDLTDGKVGTINTDYKTHVLAPKEGYVPPIPGQETQAQITPAKGMTLAYDGAKHTITNILKDGTVKAKPTGGKTIAISPEDSALGGLYDPTAHKIGSKVKAGDLQAGDLFHGGRGSTQRPYVVTGTAGNKITWRSLDTGEEGVFTKAKVVRNLDNVDSVADPAAPANTPPAAVAEGDASLAPVIGKQTTLGSLQVGNYFAVDGETFEVLQQSQSPEDNVIVAPVLPSGTTSASITAEGTFPGKLVTFKGDSATTDSKSFAQTETPSSSGMADLAMEGGFQGYKSPYGSGGKYKHEKLGDMAIGTVFQDKNGSIWKLKANDHNVIVTDGTTLYQANASLRGKVLNSEFVDETGPLPGPGTDAATATAAAGLTDNWPGLKMAELPVGSKALINGNVHKIEGFQGPNQLTVLTTLPDGSLGEINGATVPDKVSQPTKNETISVLPPNAPFWLNGEAHTVIAHSSKGTVTKTEDGELHQLPGNTAFQKWGTPASDKPEPPAKPKQIGDLKKGELFEGAGGIPHEVVAHTLDGKVVIRQGASNVAMVPPSTPLEHVNGKMADGLDPIATGALEPITSADTQWSPAVEESLGQAGAIMDDLPSLNLDGFKSKWGSGGKYQHPRLEELSPGATFIDKTGLNYLLIGWGPSGYAVIKDDSGQLHLAQDGLRIKYVSG